MNDVTIIIPAYNEAKFIEQAIVSAVTQAQTVIISDNCSTDETREICTKLRKKFNNIVFYEQNENIGSIKNFEFLLSKVTTKYVLHIGAHDYIGKGYVDALKACLEKNSSSVLAFAPFYSIDDEGKVISEDLLEDIEDTLQEPDQSTRVLEVIEQYKKVIFTIFGLFRTDILKKNYDPSPVAGVDCLLLCKCITEGTFVRCDTVRFYRRVLMREETTEAYMKRVQGQSDPLLYDLSYMCEHQMKLLDSIRRDASKQDMFSLERADASMQKLFGKRSLKTLQHTLEKLSKTDQKYILYGAGTDSKIILEHIKETITFIVDKDISKQGTKKSGLEIKSLEELKKHPHKIIISQLGRFELISDELISAYGIEKSRLISPLNNLLYVQSDTLSKGFNTALYWEERYKTGKNSGAGSYNHLAEFKADVINKFIAINNIESCIEFGCGDGNNLSLYKIKKYIGLDVSSKAVEICRNKFMNDASKKFYELEDFMELYPASRYDLSLSLDVIYHLIEEELFERYMTDLFRFSNKFVIIYSSDHEGRVASHVLHRKFTQWVKQKMLHWQLIQHIKNPYPYDEKYPKDTSFADFYIYQKLL
jgi:glycosyltransferase involved in cell wall biosynthesis